MTRFVVLLGENGSDLFLEDAKPEEGHPTSGRVVNGAWDWKLEGGEEKAYDGPYFVRSWPAQNYRVVEVPRTLSGGYNKVIRWARSEA